ncbi:DUF1904 family protein [Cohnella panacarvi]|uniref:DUF1904 family protein n=1 Tax=Cohnella panacarvi TaxID=400776 RepID=UPI0004791787|nr:DUF1904 family protein [Cohnella panacarvi]
MPHLLIRGVDPDRLASVSEALAGELAVIFDCPSDHILLECMHTTAVFAGKRVASYPFVEVVWFERGTAARDAAAACVDRYVREALGLEEMEIAFRVYTPDAYYSNGQRLGDDPSAGELAELRAKNAKLKDDLDRTRKALHGATLGGGAMSSMSSKLRDALRE